MSILVPETGFEVEETLSKLGFLLTETGQLPHALECAIEHMLLHQGSHFAPAPAPCPKSPCKLAGIAFAYMELHEWQVWTTDPARRSKVERENQCLSLLAKLDQDELVRGLKEHLLTHEVSPQLDRIQPTDAREHEDQSEPLNILGALERLKHTIRAYIDRLVVHRGVSDAANRGQGRPKEILLQATCQHLFAGGWTHEDVGKLVGCGTVRARNAIRNEDARLYQADCGVRRLSPPKGGSASPGRNEI